jgi:hypothetical protein
LGDAVDQVTNTYNTVRQHLRLINKYEVQAFLIGYDGSCPQERKKHQDKLDTCFKSKSSIYDGKPENFAKFLRGEEIPKSHQSRKDKKRAGK